MTEIAHNPSFDLRMAAELTRLAALSKDLEETMPLLPQKGPDTISHSVAITLQRLDELTQVLTALGVLFTEIGNNPQIGKEALLETLDLPSLAARLSAVPTRPPQAGEMIPL